ncbi:MAG: hypothetical protein AAFX06_06935 [Planctomycetota bacterium]
MRKAIASVAAVLVVAAGTFAAEVDLKDVKCLVAPKGANASKSADYKDGKVYFCCGGCVSKFTKNTKKYAEKANHQLVATKQYEQKGCPFSGGEVNKDTAVKFNGTSVAFCCDGCKSKFVAAKDDAAKLKLVFNDKAFKAAFKKVEKETSK